MYVIGFLSLKNCSANIRYRKKIYIKKKVILALFWSIKEKLTYPSEPFCKPLTNNVSDKEFEALKRIPSPPGSLNGTFTTPSNSSLDDSSFLEVLIPFELLNRNLQKKHIVY